MSLKFCSISSGSRGNCYVAWRGNNAFLIDVGISGKKIMEGIENIGISPNTVEGIFITHEHTDHVKSLKAVCKKLPNAQIYANRPTWEALLNDKIKDREVTERYVEMPTGKVIARGDIKISSVGLHHDAAEPVGYTFSVYEQKLSIITDTGHICKEIFNEIKDSSLLVLESNHEEAILQVCDYPYNVKMRILSDYGHLSNKMAGGCIEKMVMHLNEDESRNELNVLLAHLSKDNNTPHMAALSAKNAILRSGLRADKKVYVDVIKQDEISLIYHV